MNTIKKYTVKNFVKEFNLITADDLKEKFLEKILNIKYVPYERKITICEKIIESSYYIKVKRNEKEINKLHVNSPGKYMLFCLQLIQCYTNIEVNFKDCLNEFNELNGSELLDIIYKNIPDREINEFRMILDMVENDVIFNEHETHSFISNQVERFGELIGVGIKPMIKELNDSLRSLDKNKIINILSKK